MRQPHSAASLTIVVCAVALFVALACAVLHEGAATALDRDVLAWLRERAGPGLVRGMHVVSALHAPRAIVVMTTLVALVLAWRRDWIDMAMVLVVVFGGATLNHLLKHGLQRARPVFGQVATGPTDFSFPSGHVANATLLYGVVAALIICRFRAWPIRLGSAHGAALAAVLVGVAWLALCLGARDRLRERGGASRRAG